MASGFLITDRCENCHGEGHVVETYGEQHWEEVSCDCTARAPALFRHAYFPSRFDSITLATLDWNALTPLEIGQGVRDYVLSIEDSLREGLGMFLYGNVGTGKTHIAVGIGKLACGLGFSTLFYTVADFLEDLRSGYSARMHSQHNHDDEKPYDALGAVHACDLLIFDDLGMHQDSDWVREKLYQVVNTRWLQRTPTIVTTNSTPEALAERVGEGVLSRLWGDAVALHFAGSDYRLRMRQARIAQVREAAGTPV